MSFKTVARATPTLVVLLLFNLNLSFAAPPVFAYPPGTVQNAKRNVTQAFKDALTLAKVVAITATDCDPAFLRYFQPQDYTFVQRVFKTIANMDLFMEINAQDIPQLLSASGPASTWNPDFLALCIAYGDNPFNPPASGHSCLDSGDNAYTIYDTSADARFSGLISLCPGSGLFTYRLSLKDTENPPAWARAGGMPDGTPLPGFGCAGLGDRDTAFMKVMGSTVLHELLHWPWMFLSVPDYDRLIPDHDHRIWDYDGPWVPGGAYGPYNTMRINQLPADPRTGKSQSLQNADNYVWYALSRYWSFRCGRSFGPALSAADDQNLPTRARGPGG
ncbi:uncharacterized protein A1O5_05868 [Cladophialophora psammophila CBS 110553]|uniref:Lysine-specific metallo-endopeptidase domain-containing protein n=1 Tax=Cladophialophora psammophila CBS 110553 TaxID=1182543 RepID=W9X1U8_9EURO|nr:uncharacterized protein A1O5_05868 [Cladophialophora psammophila CBS 110553]EXJ70876.1 hypothetical protein A1O5_05868 [Cladophialophora psammophila CBS 110553]